MERFSARNDLSRLTLNGLRAIVAWVLKATLLQQRFQVVAPHPEAVVEHAGTARSIFGQLVCLHSSRLMTLSEKLAV
jgi:hypothetical protein